MDNRQLKSGKRTQKYFLIVNLIGGAILFVVVIVVLLYGRVDLTDIFKVEEKIVEEDIPESPGDDSIPELLDKDSIFGSPSDDSIPESPDNDSVSESPNDDSTSESLDSDSVFESPSDDIIPELPDDDSIFELPSDDIIPESPDNEQREALRQKYITQMNRYENEVKPAINALNLAAWSPDSVVELQTKEREAIKAFAETRYGQALNHLDDLFEKVSELQLLQRQKFELALRNAEQAFEANQTTQAQSAINDALRYLPEAAEALLLKERISTMEAVATLVKQADVARIENNLDAEINLLGQAIELDPYRDTLIERHKMLIAKQRQQKLDALLQRTSQALDNKNIKTAQTSLRQIKQIDANHPSLSLLTARLRQIQTELSYQNLIAKAKTSADTDDWQSAENHYRQALAIYPDNKDTGDNLQRAVQINQYTGIIKQALAKPERLADEQIAAAMKQIAEDSIISAEYSAKLQQLVRQLNAAITEMSKPVAVTVYSDEKTYVSVLGIGVIGKVREYRLKAGLKPGLYRFKGERKGYQDKLVEINIKPNQPATVRIICDEPI